MSPVLHLLAERAPEDIDPEATRLGLLLLWLADDVIHSVNTQLRDFGITEKKLDVLLIFDAQTEEYDDSGSAETKMRQTPTGISEYFGISPATATTLLDWLEKRKLVARKDHPTDRRSTQVEITSAGRGMVEASLPVFLRACNSLVAALPKKDREALDRALVKIWKQLKSALPR